MKKLACCAAVLAALASVAQADAMDENTYAGIGLGYTKFKATNKDYNFNLKGKFGAKLYVGYQFHPNVAVEAGYTFLNKHSYTDNDGTETLRFHTVPVVANFKLPVNDQFSVFATLGGAWLQTRNSEPSEKSKRNTFAPVFGVGVEFNVDKQVVVRAQYENFGRPKLLKGESIKAKRLDLFSIGIRSNFN